MPVVHCSVKLLLSLYLLLNFAFGTAHAFGAKAHRVAGYIAEAELCRGSRAALSELIPHGDLAEAGLWADRIRADKQWDVARPWHYINVPDDVAIAAAPRSRKGDVLLAISDFRQQLSNRTLARAKREVALYMLVHFVVDVHQPLHVGRRQDLGGNLVPVRAGEYRGNLHSYWDSQIFQFVDDAPAYARKLQNRFAAESMLWEQAPPIQWASESQQLRASVYAFGYDADGLGLLEPGYEQMARAVAERRLAQAGSRLARMLNDIWCSQADGAETGS
jgi:hypothetical protein